MPTNRFTTVALLAVVASASAFTVDGGRFHNRNRVIATTQDRSSYKLVAKESNFDFIPQIAEGIRGWVTENAGSAYAYMTHGAMQVYMATQGCSQGLMSWASGNPGNAAEVLMTGIAAGMRQHNMNSRNGWGDSKRLATVGLAGMSMIPLCLWQAPSACCTACRRLTLTP